ncbi:hypothetical protein CAI21_09760 [Alkalilimnicola ehrlichii]|uniref:O-antigen polymerase n=1 Tax=Alkalilimnicola ehrlichii TaxID=351052 RepID=A0A3E0WV53_9GAMM|nr:hypothetical protein [Alkalilimnicola ehrlichii]RFA29346.1 hypothetical protein CAI21_09760 [Alkalilimnicola ehrlichii]RFA36860.1 hypothetical protein CAL65_10095 [Alkalilimnicola ehrlichii]
MAVVFDTPSTEAPRSKALAALRWCPLWVTLLLLTLALPTEFSFTIGSFRLTPYRLVLILAFLPGLARLFSGAVGRVTLIDCLLILHVVWGAIAYTYVHGLDRSVEAAGVRTLEVLGAYLIARAWITDERSFRGACAMLFLILIVIAPLVLLEAVTGVHFIKDISAALMGTHFHSDMSPRFGITRAYGPFDHPILLGVFSASVFALAAMPALPALGRPSFPKMPRRAVLVSSFSSVSTGAIAALVVQIGLMVWEKLTRNHAGRWKLLTFLVVVLYISVDVLSNRSAYQVFLHYLTFSAQTAYMRVLIFEYASAEMLRNPIFGIGFNDWTRPGWMHAPSIDNFWVVQGVRIGLPGLLTIAIPVLLMPALGWKRLPPRLTRLRMAWTFSLVGMIVAACTVHFWNNLFVYFFFFLGAGAWFLNVTRTERANKEVRDDE